MNQIHPERPDDPHGVAQHQDRYLGGVALVVLGGPSGAGWAELRDEIKPDVILTANGATRLPGADYWLLTENMTFCHTMAQRGYGRLAEFLHVFDEHNTARVQMVSHRSWHLLRHYNVDPENCISIRRAGYDTDEIPDDFTLRTYGQGFLAGGITASADGWNPSVRVRSGTVGLQLLHLAGILGCAEVHTIGFDLMFPDPERHHWYEHPKYIAGRFRSPAMFVEHRGAATQKWWIRTAEYLKSIEYLFERERLLWRDHSDGLLKIEGLACAN